MTGYARVHHSSVLGDFVLEIHSVNRKGLDFNIYIPKELLVFDLDLRKWLSQELQRGQVSLRLTLSAAPRFSKDYIEDLKRSKERWGEVCEQLQCDPKEVRLSFLIEQLPLKTSLSSDEESSFREHLKQAVQEALKALLQMKREEGVALVEDMQKKLSHIEKNLKSIEALKDTPIRYYREKISEKLQEIGLIDEDLKMRVAKEVAILAEKTDITEEIVRLGSHIEQMRKHFVSSAASIGRVLEFLAQEMLREINTIGSKSQDREIAGLVIEMKGDLDRIKEQIQNIE